MPASISAAGLRLRAHPRDPTTTALQQAKKTTVHRLRFALAVEVKGGLIFLWNAQSRQDFLLTAE